MIAARTRQLTIVVHAVDDSGALCGARPVGNWRVSMRVPVNCPSCLMTLASPRFAACETPSARGSLRHLRRVGLEGVGGGVGTSALCGAVVGWDVGLFDQDGGELERVCPACRGALRRETIRLAKPA